jgi:hypothetical protein
VSTGRLRVGEVLLSTVSSEVGCYHQEAGNYEEAIFGEGEALQHPAMTLRSAHQDGAAREGHRLRG